jgi:hypothetical protein
LPQPTNQPYVVEVGEPRDHQMSQAGWHFLQIPGLTNFHNRSLCVNAPTIIDDGGPEFASLFSVLTPFAESVQAR